MLFKIWSKYNKEKCDICKGTEGKVLTVRRYPLDWTYHQECLRKVVCNPEKYPDWIGYAYKVTKIIEEDNARENREIEALKRLQPKYECKETR
jgi:hypothetical protein